MQLIPRKDKTITETITNSVTLKEVSTITNYINSTIYSSFFFTVTATLNHTTVTTTTVQATPPPELASLYNELSLHRSSTLARIAPVVAPASTSEGSISPGSTATPMRTAGVSSSTGHTFKPTEILGIVLGSLAFLGVVVTALLLTRSQMKKYRQQRVDKKRAVTEGNPMPLGIRYEGNGNDTGFQQQNMTGGTNPFFQQQATGTTNTAMPRPLTTYTSHLPLQHQNANSSQYPHEKSGEVWEEPPAYRA